MPTETIHFRVEYSNGAVYHIIASTNVDKMTNWNAYFPNQIYSEKNGLASLFMKSENAQDLFGLNKNVFIPGGNAQAAAEDLISRLNLLNKESKPLFKMEY